MHMYKFKTRAREYQMGALKRVLRLALDHGGAGLQVPMRYGKTWIAINFAGALCEMKGLKRVLIIAPPSAVPEWERQIPVHAPDDVEIDWKVITYQTTYQRYYPVKGSREWYAGVRKDLADWGPDIVICDESHRIGDPSAMQSQYTYKLTDAAQYKLCMTGTAFHRMPLYMFGQMRVVDPSVFGSVFGAFKSAHIIYGGAGGHQIVGYRLLGQMMSKVHSRFFVEETVPYGSPEYVYTKYSLDSKGAKAYNEMNQESLLDLGEGKASVAPLAVTRHMRLQMLCSGWARDEEGDLHHIHSAKKGALIEKLQGYMDEDIQKVVIGCRFRPELQDIKEAAEAVGYRVITYHGGVAKTGPKGRGVRVQTFHATNKPTAFVCQMDSVREGVDLSCADTALAYSLPESFLTYDQWSARIARYQETRKLLYDHMYCPGTAEEVTMLALKLKKNVTDLIWKEPALVEKITHKQTAKKKSATVIELHSGSHTEPKDG